MIFLWMLAFGLATMKIVEFVKEVIPWPLQPGVKSILSGLVAVALSAWHNGGLSNDTLLLGLGASGVSMILHEVQAVLSYIGDKAKQEVIIRGAGRSRL